MTLRQRWEKSAPVARVAFRGARGTEVAEVYDFQATGHAMWTMAISRNNFLSRILIASQHLLFIVGLRTFTGSDFKVDVRIHLDDGFHLDALLSSIHPHVYGAWEALVLYGGVPTRALISQFAMIEIVPLHDTDEDIELLSVDNVFSCELWPELGHKE